MHDHFSEHDAAIADWMARHNWPVTMRHYDFDRDILAWRATAVTPAITVRVSLNVCNDVPASTLVAFFDAAKLDQTLAGSPDRYTVVVQDAANRKTVIVQLPHAP
jgi:hypothetical protein